MWCCKCWRRCTGSIVCPGTGSGKCYVVVGSVEENFNVDVAGENYLSKREWGLVT